MEQKILTPPLSHFGVAVLLGVRVV
jgi:hypothetical protein